MRKYPEHEGDYRYVHVHELGTVDLGVFAVRVYWDNWLGGLATYLPWDEIPYSVRQVPGEWKGETNGQRQNT